jgi:hypothetical protein
VLPEAQQVGPFQSWPPHWPHLVAQLVPGAEVVGFAEVVVVVRVEVLMVVEVEAWLVLDEDDPLPSPGAGALKVEPMGPNLMLEKATFELGDAASIWDGTPEVVEHEPRAAPREPALSAGKVESSQSMLDECWRGGFVFCQRVNGPHGTNLGD